MPLDTGAVTGDLNLSWGSHPDRAAMAPGVGDGPNLGGALRAIREFRRIDLTELEKATRIRQHYLLAIEDMRLDLLPSRPFTIGFVRAYAAALGVDPEQAVLRFRRDAPDKDEPLRAPLGVTRERDPRLAVVGVCCAIVVGFGAGSVLAHQIGRSIFSSDISIPPVLLPVILAIAVMVTFAGSAAAIRRAVGLDPVFALRGEL